MSERPEWFELTAEDPAEPIKQPKRKFLKFALLGVPLLMVGSAMVFAEGKSEAEENPSHSITEMTSIENSEPQKVISNIDSPDNSTVQKPKTISSSNIGIKPPTGNREDDDEFEEREHEGREHEGRERGEHREREGAPKIPTTNSNN